jgi:glyoxylase-like metal-dependent hydrolase (beta-lactamase superfamily II)
VEELLDGIHRVTLPLPAPPRHVHVYLLREHDGWTLVDTGLALPELEERLAEVGAALDAPVVRIVVTHFHPDHVGGAEVAANVLAAGVYQGALDYEQCEQVWGDHGWPERIAAWFRLHGVPREISDEVIAQGGAFGAFIRFARDPAPLREGDRVGNWHVLELPGHADGHLVLLRDGVLIAGDHVLPDISPTVGLYPNGLPDPLAAYLASLRRTIELAPTVALPGHGEPIGDPSRRARELIAHHEERLDAAAAAVTRTPQTGYELSLALFESRLDAAGRRFAVAETLAHLERLVAAGRVARQEDSDTVTYTQS